MKYFVLPLFALLIFASCTKPAPTQVLSVEDMLRTGKWKVSEGSDTFKTFSFGFAQDTVVIDSIPDCHQDDYIVFGPNLNGFIYSGTKKCDVSEPDQIGFTWQPVNNDSGINFFGAASLFGRSIYDRRFVNYSPSGSNIVNTRLLSFSQSNFVLQYYVTFTDPFKPKKTDSIRYTLTFTNF
ncbi:MAG: hypothetical protein H0X33_10570 [Taibaiella sp.]|nr:hypothetical protein [Taibaiella sp.]